MMAKQKNHLTTTQVKKEGTTGIKSPLPISYYLLPTPTDNHNCVLYH